MILRHPANGKIPPKEKQFERPQHRVGLRLTHVVAETSQRDGINCTLLGGWRRQKPNDVALLKQYSNKCFFLWILHLCREKITLSPMPLRDYRRVWRLNVLWPLL